MVLCGGGLLARAPGACGPDYSVVSVDCQVFATGKTDAGRQPVDACIGLMHLKFRLLFRFRNLGS